MNGVVAAAGASSRSLDVRVACDEDGDAWPTRRSDNGNRFRADQQLLRYRLSCSLVLSIHPTLSLQLPPSRRLFLLLLLLALHRGLRHRSSFCVSFSPFYLPSGTTSGRTPLLLLPSLSLSLVSQTLAKPHLGNGLSCCTSS